VILGTAAFTQPGLLEEALEKHGVERVMVSVDVRAGRVSIEGWTNEAEIDVREVFARLGERGVQEMLYTNVDRDGMLEGPSDSNVMWVAKAAAPAHLVYSGGIGQLDDLSALARLPAPNLKGVIVGKALYEGRFTIAEAQVALAG
jgi:phosphoribosylformimino-5-aminoimidazole carboxamide ribotide isomerase